MKQIFTASIMAIALGGCANSSKSPPHAAPPAVEPWDGWDRNRFEPGPDEESPSLWSNAPGSLLSMRRAKDVGDLLTVVVEMDDQASIQSSLSRSRGSKEDLNINALFGLPDAAGAVLPNGAGLSPAFDFNRNSDLNGKGAVSRADKVAFTLAARVVGLEPNGNLMIEGYQQIRISDEVRYLTVAGVIRAQDVTRTNTVTYEKIAEANLSYVSRGDTTGLKGRRAAPKILDAILPF